MWPTGVKIFTHLQEEWHHLPPKDFAHRPLVLVEKISRILFGCTLYMQSRVQAVHNRETAFLTYIENGLEIDSQHLIGGKLYLIFIKFWLAA